MTEEERWLPVVGYEGWYSVSSLGRVRRDAGGPNASPGSIRKLTLTGRGYLTVSLSKPGITVKHPSVHKLVAEAFISIRPIDCTGVNHLSGVKTENHVENLEWASPARQMEHAKATGLTASGARSSARKHPDSYRGDRNGARIHPESHRGKKNGSARLTEAAVKDILTSPLTGTALATKYGVGQSTISRVRRRTHWGYVAV